jgi:hypothetical protein
MLRLRAGRAPARDDQGPAPIVSEQGRSLASIRRVFYFVHSVRSVSLTTN